MVEPEIVFEPSIAPYMVKALTVFEPSIVPYRVVPEMTPVVTMLFEPSIAP